MGEKLSRREFVKRAAVATAGALIGSKLQLVHQAAQQLKAAAAAAEDSDPEPEESRQTEQARLIVELYERLDLEGRRVITSAIREMYARHCSRVN